MPNSNKTKTNNQRLRELVAESGLSQQESLAVFNRGLGPAAYSLDAWKAFLAKPDTKRFRPLKAELLQHAEAAFSSLRQAA